MCVAQDAREQRLEHEERDRDQRRAEALAEYPGGGLQAAAHLSAGNRSADTPLPRCCTARQYQRSRRNQRYNCTYIRLFHGAHQLVWEKRKNGIIQYQEILNEQPCPKPEY